MLKQQSIIEIKKGERVYQLVLAMDSPLGEVHDVLYQMRSYIIERINEAYNQDKIKEKDSELEQKSD